MRRSRQMARARIELATPRFSVVIHCEKTGHDRRLRGKKCLQTGQNSVPSDLRVVPGYCVAVDLW